MQIIETHIIENGHNTSYITSLITALFYLPEHSTKLLHTIPQNKKFIFIQEFIKDRFIMNFKRGGCIYSHTINEFRNYLNICGWRLTINEMINEHDIGEFYSYIINGIYGESNLFFEKINDGIKEGEYKTNIIDLIINSEDVNNISELFKSWINRNITMNKEYTYKMYNKSDILPIRIRRTNEKTKIDIMKYIKLFDCDNSNTNDFNIIWKIQSIICYNNNIGYYSIIFVSKTNEWIMISDKMIPSIKKINMKYKKDVEDISENAIILFYNCNKLN